jgi:hypothetical protein
VAELNVNPADLLRIADAYTDLAARAAQLPPQAATEVQRITETHGPMGYPTAIGIAAGLANAERPLNMKIADFHTYSQRFTEHAATYATRDRQAAQRYSAPSTDLFDTTHAQSLHLPPPTGYIIWCTPGGPMVPGFICEFMGEDGGITWRHSPIDITGGMP